jgi:Ca2+-binding RTX toxin-like protein
VPAGRDARRLLERLAVRRVLRTRPDRRRYRHTIVAGKGNDSVSGGGGHNVVTVGGGGDAIYGGPLGDAINAGYKFSGNDPILLGSGPHYTGSAAVATGSGNNVVHAKNHARDLIVCQHGNQTTVYADKIDIIIGCANLVLRAPTVRP